MSEPEKKSPAIQQSATKFQPVKFLHERSPRFTTYHSDGQWGVVNADNEIHLNFFSEYPRLASGVINKVDSTTGRYSGEHEMLGASDPNYFITIREFQCSVVFSIVVAERLHTILGHLIEAAKKQREEQRSRGQKNE